MISISSVKQNLFHPSEELQLKYTLWMNYFLVIYAFFLPISHHANAQLQFGIIILFFLRRNYLKYLRKHLSNKVVQAFILYFLLYLLWFFGTENIDYAKTLLSYNKYTLFFPLLILSFIDKRFVIKVVFGFLFGVLFSEFISYLVSFNILPWRLSLWGKEVYTCSNQNDPSPFLNHSHYGLTLALAVSLLIVNLIMNQTNLKEKLISIFFISTATINLSITGGRIGYITYLFLAVTIVFLIYKKKLTPLFLALGLTTIIAITAYSASPLFKIRIDYSIQTLKNMEKNSKDFNSSFGQRVGVWYYSFDIIKDNLLWGVGTGDHIDAYRSIIPKENNFLLDVSHPHNQFISVTLQFGLIGLFIFLNIYFQIFKYNYQNNYYKNIAYLTTIALILSFLIEGDNVKYYIPLLLLFVSISMASKTHELKIYSENKSLFLYMILLFVGATLAFFV